MTGTADTEAYEFQEIYGLETVVDPDPHGHDPRGPARPGLQDRGARSIEAMLADIKDCYERGQPVLVGTTSIENSEMLAAMLQKANLPHQVLNAKQHAREAEIVAQAGRPKMITIATNMAGRGTDIVLGGNVEKQVDVVRADPRLDEAGKEARIVALRAEWQHAARAGGRRRRPAHHRHRAPRVAPHRQSAARPLGPPGRPGVVALLPRRSTTSCCGSSPASASGRSWSGSRCPRASRSSTRSSPARSRARSARSRRTTSTSASSCSSTTTSPTTSARTSTSCATEILENEGLAEMVKDLRDGVVTDVFRAHVPAESVEEQWDIPGLETDLRSRPSACTSRRRSGWKRSRTSARRRCSSGSSRPPTRRMRSRCPRCRRKRSRQYRALGHCCRSLDTHWREHLGALDHLRQGIHLRGYAQKNPKQEYKREAFELFGAMLETRQAGGHARPRPPRPEDAGAGARDRAARGRGPRPRERRSISTPQLRGGARRRRRRGGSRGAGRDPAQARRLSSAQMGKVGRNDPCPCGSGKKYKHCHGRLS